MGLSPGKDKKKVNAAEQRTTSSIDAVSAPDPLNEAIRAKTKAVVDWDNYRGGDKNVLDMPGINDYMDVYGSAEDLANQEQMGGGAMRLADPSSSAYSDQVKELGKNQRYDSRAAGISNAAQMLKADAYGQADSLINRELQKKLGVANLNLGNQQQIYGRYKKQNPWYQKLWNAGLQAAQVGAKMYGGM